ncbi:hypothetical protein GQ457_03G005470 [Hibiscus cannabinus]
MAELPKKTHKTPPKTGRFLGCFGKKNPPENPIKTGTRNKTRSPSFSMPCFSATKTGSKTVPVDSSDNKAVAAAESHAPPKLIKKKSGCKTPSRKNPKADQQQSPKEIYVLPKLRLIALAPDYVGGEVWLV